MFDRFNFHFMWHNELTKCKTRNKIMETNNETIIKPDTQS